MAESPIILGNYELLEVVGDGAEGRVYRARCLAETASGVGRGEFVALKRLKNTGHEKDSLLFRRQTEILRRLNHPNIVRYRDSFVSRETDLDDEVYCLVMEWLDGEPLKALLEKNPKGLSWEQAKGIFSQTLDALQYASKCGVIHRDLKPSNIYVTREGVAKLIDFGIARQEDAGTTTTSSVAAVKGSFDYMAPDFARLQGNFRGDERSDIYSFGVCLYHALTGRLPFPSVGDKGIMGYFSRWHAPPSPELDFSNPMLRVLGHARSCLAKCLEPDQSQRFQSFVEVMAEMNRIAYRKLRHGAEVYEFIGWLGKGSFGEVFRGRRLSDKREVAIKRLFSARHSARFIREAKILRNAAHPNLVEYIDFVEVGPRENELEYYLVLEFLDGMPGASLRYRIKSSVAGMEPVETLRLFLGYLDCLEHLHQTGIIHRDIKPGNLYAPADAPEKGKVFDLGIAHDEEGTRTQGQVPGTLDYMPPEFGSQDKDRGSPQSDIYSTGVTLYQALTKSLPFPRLPEGETEALVAFLRRSETPPECSFDHALFNKCPELIPLFRRALATDLKHRYADAKTMRNEVQTILEGWDRARTKGAYDAAMAGALLALHDEDHQAAQRLANQALELWPDDRAAALLVSRVQEDRRKGRLYKAAVAAAQEALAEEDYEEVRRQAQRALSLRPEGAAAIDLLSQAQSAAKREQKPLVEADDRSTGVTKATLTAPRPEDSTFATAPANMASLQGEAAQTAPLTSPDPVLETHQEPAPEGVIVMQQSLPEQDVEAPQESQVLERNDSLGHRRLVRGQKASLATIMVLTVALVAALYFGKSFLTTKIAHPLEKATSPLPPALALYGAKDFVMNLGDGVIRIPCHVFDPDGLDLGKDTSRLEMLPRENIWFESVIPPAGPTNGFIVLTPIPGYTGTVAIGLGATTPGAATNSYGLVLRILGEALPPQFDEAVGKVVLEEGSRTKTLIKVSSLYFPTEKLLLNCVLAPAGVVNVDVVNKELHLTALKAGEAQASLIVASPNGLKATNRFEVVVVPKQPQGDK